ncbi:hypothetical protein M422DRAFT_171792 [Sphaerobolus stellatus SS14]|uniref:WD40 repeat-like protein n=1 Tax=Sphaerobolus stellatus (strain SS14) TaxID=990650 RepID=A0A0C9VJI3_SPHS4|nr:hypothetical protein M422DRAFT_171792 [Sphaerobolus stellatus SS14]
MPFCSQNSKVPSLPVVQLLQGTLDQPLIFQLQGHTDWVSSVSFSPDGRYIASGSGDQTVHLWSVETGMPVDQPYEGHTKSVNSVSFSPDGRYIASGSDDGTVCLWSVETGMPVGQPYEGHTKSVNSVSFSPDGRYIASGSYDDTVRLWSVETGMPVGQPYEGHTYLVSSVSFSPDGRYIASGCHFQMFNSYQISPTSQHSPLLHEFPMGFLQLAANGWIVTHTGNRVFWIPTDLRKGLFMPGTSHIFSVKTMIKVDLTGFYLGTEWKYLLKAL